MSAGLQGCREMSTKWLLWWRPVGSDTSSINTSSRDWRYRAIRLVEIRDAYLTERVGLCFLWSLQCKSEQRHSPSLEDNPIISRRRARKRQVSRVYGRLTLNAWICMTGHRGQSELQMFPKYDIKLHKITRKSKTRQRQSWPWWIYEQNWRGWY